MIHISHDNGKTFDYDPRDTILFRLNIYSVTSKNEFTNILTQPVYLKWDTDNSIYPKYFDLSEHNLVIDDKVLISFEFFDNVSMRSNIRFNGTIFGADTYIRSASQGSWKRQFNSVGIFVDAVVKN